MPLKIVTAEERLSKANLKTSCAIFGPPGVGKTHLLTTLPVDKTSASISRQASSRCRTGRAPAFRFATS